MHITQVEREMAVEALCRLTPAALQKAIPASLRKMVIEAEGKGRKQTKREVAEFLLDLYGLDILAQPGLREQFCLTLDGAVLMDLRDAAGLSDVKGSRARIAQAVAQRKWYAGKWWPRHFAATMGLPYVFAGSPAPPADPDFEDVEVYQRPPELYPYQEQLRDQVIDLLQAPTDRNRAILSLPTGAGKTRTAVEALVRAMEWGVLRRPRVLWIAQSDELCEQAVGTFRAVWQAKGKVGESLRIHRLWGGRSLPDLGQAAVIVASIQKLYQMLRQREDEQELQDLGRELGALVIDEAHHSIAPSYTAVLQALGLTLTRRGTSLVPVLGLTATPYRGDAESERLARRYHSKLLVPWSSAVNPVEKLQREGILARAIHEVVATGRTYDMTEAENRSLEIFNDFPDSFIKKIGADSIRNQAIVDRIGRLDPTWPVLFFGCSKEHACAMAVLLRRKGIAAAVVTAETGRAARRAIVEEFKAGRIQVLCNYGIFTTGFDAPGVRSIVVARPTASVVLYEQMIGRGMRGPKNGGTEECLIVDFSDNLERFGVPMAHTRFAEYWRTQRPVRQTTRSGVKS